MKGSFAPRRTALGCALAGLLLATTGAPATAAPDTERELSAGLAAGSDGISAVLWCAPVYGALDLGIRGGLGFEWTDYQLNDPVASLCARWRLLESGRWAWYLGAEGGAALLDTGYDRLAVPYIGGTTSVGARLGSHLVLSAELGARYGRRTRESSASLAFLDVRYRETLFLDPWILRLGAAWRLR